MRVQPRLSRGVVAALPHDQRGAVDVPPVRVIGLPERIVQFGTGAFLRGFVDYFVDQANRRGVFSGSIVAVSSTATKRDAQLNEQDGLYTLVIQGVYGDATQASEQ